MADFLRIVIWHIKRFPQPKGLLELVSYPLLDSADMVKLRHVEWSLNGHFYYYRIVSINLTVDHHFSARSPGDKSSFTVNAVEWVSWSGRLHHPVEK